MSSTCQYTAFCRPVTYIREYIDSTWLPLIGTPPFPEYPSGHSSQSGAMAEVMENVFGSSYAFTDYTHGTNFGGPRSFVSFDEAAIEAATSRLYGGIHFRFGNEAGLTLGTIVGQNVNDLFNQLNVSTQDPNGPLANLTVYPNPAQDYVSIKSSENIKGASFQLLDAFGKVVSNGMINDEITTMNLASLSSGIYFIRLGSDDTFTYKVVKN